MRLPVWCSFCSLAATVSLPAAPSTVTFSPNKPSVDAYAFVEGEMRVCLAEPGRTYVAYLRTGRPVEVKLAPGQYEAEWFNPRTGRRSPAGTVQGPAWKSPAAPDNADWAILLRKR